MRSIFKKEEPREGKCMGLTMKRPAPHPRHGKEAHARHTLMSKKHSFPLVGSLPKVGIRPTIDGRRKGVRESLEQQVMAMARNAAKFLSANLRYPNGKRVECVIADTCIGAMTGRGATVKVAARWSPST